MPSWRKASFRCLWQIRMQRNAEQMLDEPSNPAALFQRANHSAFARIALGPSTSKMAPVVRAMLKRAPRWGESELDGVPFLVAEYDARLEHLPPLIDILTYVSSWKSAIIVVRGRYFPPNKDSKLYQWISCLARQLAEHRPSSHCHCIADDMYRLEHDERLELGDAMAGIGWPGEPRSNNPLLSQRFRLPCHLLRAFTVRTLDRHSDADLPQQIADQADSIGISACPRYDASAFMQIKNPV